MKELKAFIMMYFMLVNSIFADSGGSLSPEQAAYDVKYYDLNLSINPDTKSITGSLLCRAEVLNSLSSFVLDLNNTYTIDSILYQKGSDAFSSVQFSFTEGKIRLTLPSPAVNGDMISAKIFYHGIPRVSSSPPWDGGFVWNKTASDKHWIGVACETEGADVWWPCKDHPSDEPDSMSLSFIVPTPLSCISNGRFIGSKDNGNGTTTFNWFVSTPINNYNVSIYIAEYRLIQDTYKSINGENIPFYFWVLPENYDKAVGQMDVFKKEFDFLESICGPFPFGKDKHGFANAPYWGMEHQTIVAYGHDFTLNDWGFDYIHYHEMAHEWWGNLITAKDWADVWIHEGIATYTEALYVEHLSGKTSLYQFVDQHRPANNHTFPLAPREPFQAGPALFDLNPYNRGASVLHTLRYYLGDETFFKVLKGWAYPDTNDTDNTHGRLCRIVSTDDLKIDAERISGKDLDNFFEVFYRQIKYPTLKVAKGSKETTFTWITENNIPLDLSVPVSVNGIPQTIEMTDGKGTAAITLSDNLVIDPQRWILMATKIITEVDETDSGISEYKLAQNYPNPFNPTTTITYSVPVLSKIKISITDSVGRLIKEIKETREAGSYEFQFDGTGLPSGVYLYSLQADAVKGNISYKDVRKMTLLK